MTDVRKSESHPDLRPADLRPIDEARIREAVRIAVKSCRECEAGTDCMGPLMDLFKFLPAEVRAIVDDEQARALGEMVGGD